MKNRNYFSEGIKYLVTLTSISVALVSTEADIHANQTDAKGLEKQEKQVEKRKKSLEDILKEEKINLNVHDVHIRAVLEYIAEITKTNIVFYEIKNPEESKNNSDCRSSEDVKEQGEYRVTSDFKNMPVLDIIEFLTRTKGLTFYIKEDVMYVGKHDELVNLTDLVTKVYALKPSWNTKEYVLKDGGTGYLTEKIKELLSERGDVFLNEKVNKLIVSDKEDVIEKIDKLGIF